MFDDGDERDKCPQMDILDEFEYDLQQEVTLLKGDRVLPAALMNGGAPAIASSAKKIAPARGKQAPSLAEQQSGQLSGADSLGVLAADDLLEDDDDVDLDSLDSLALHYCHDKLKRIIQ